LHTPLESDGMKILVASSGRTDESNGPLAAAASFPWPAGSEIHVLSVIEAVPAVVAGTAPGAPDVTSLQIRSKAEAWRTAASAAARLAAAGLRAEGVTVEGNPETAILDHAREWGADVILVGMRDRSLLEKLLLGSVSEGVVKHAPCSVLVVKHAGAA